MSLSIVSSQKFFTTHFSQSSALTLLGGRQNYITLVINFQMLFSGIRHKRGKNRGKWLGMKMGWGREMGWGGRRVRGGRWVWDARWVGVGRWVGEGEND